MKRTLIILSIVLSFNSFSDVVVITEDKEVGNYFKQKVNDVKVINIQSEKDVKNEINQDAIKEVIELSKKEFNEISKIKINEKSKNIFLESIKYFYSNQEKMRDLLLKSVKEDNNNYLAYFYLGYYEQYLNNNPRQAVKYYEQVIKINPEYPMAYNNLSDSYEEIGNRNEAEKIRKNLTSLFPDFPETYYQAGMKYREEKNFLKSTESFETAIKKYKNLSNTKFYTYLGSDLKEEYIMDAELYIITNYLNTKNFLKALDYFLTVYPSMKQKKYAKLSYIIEALESYNERVVKSKNINEYKQNLKKIQKFNLQ